MDISLILCTYNRWELLPKALESLAGSIVPDSISWEVLVVDNNSRDRTRAVVDEFSTRYQGRFRYIFEPQQGKSYALNTGIREARSEVLAFTDDDAIVAPNWLWSLTASLLSGKAAGAGGRIIPVWPGPLPPWISTSDPHTMGPYVAFDLGSEPSVLKRPPYGVNMAFSKTMFARYGGFRPELGPRPGSEIRREDIEFANRLLAAGEPLRYEPDAVVYHPVPAARLTKRFVLEWWYAYGRSEVADLGPPADAGRRIAGVPLNLLRRLLRWTLQSMISIRPQQRFSCQRNIWYISGLLLGCYEHQGRPREGFVTPCEIGGPHSDSLSGVGPR